MEESSYVDYGGLSWLFNNVGRPSPLQATLFLGQVVQGYLKQCQLSISQRASQHQHSSMVSALTSISDR